ncbi:MAG: molybdopterin cofactor-binding domain-containing protein [Anaerolineae bacterium]
MVSQAWGENIDNLDIVDGNVISYKSEGALPLKNIVIYGDGEAERSGDRWPDRARQLHADVRYRPRSANRARSARGGSLHNGRASRRGGSDLDTGKVEIIKAVAAFDMGKAINPEMVKAQMEGASCRA